MPAPDTTTDSPPFLFLTGATGHTGSRAARRLLADGWRLRCLLHTPARGRFLPDSPDLEIVPGDITDPAPWLPRLRGAAAFLNMAHVGFADYVVAACRETGIRRVLSLSSTRRFTRFPERTARMVIDGEVAYAASGLDWTVLRASMIFGGDRDNNLEKVVRWLRRHRWMPLIAGGTNLVQPIFVLDLVDAISRAVADRSGATSGRALTLAGPEPMTQRAMIETIAAAMDCPLAWVPVPFGAAMAAGWTLERIRPRRPFATRDQFRRMLEDKTFDITEAQAALGGWSPRPFAEAIRLKLAGEA